jgi:hypothetical protein
MKEEITMKHSMMKKTFCLALSGLALALTFSHIAFGAQEPKTNNLNSALAQSTVTALEPKTQDQDAALNLTAFTYQGQLKDANGPVNGSFGFQFTLYSARTGGEELGANEIEEVVLTNGMFSFKLDFGRVAPEAKESWLEIGVRPSGSAEPYTVLFPRQKLTPTPYAIFAQHEPWSLIGVPVGFAGGVEKATVITDELADQGVTDAKKVSEETAKNSDSAKAKATDVESNAAAPNGVEWTRDPSGYLYTTNPGDRVSIGTGTTKPNHLLRLSGGPNWTSNSWGGALELGNGSAIGWQANAAGQRFGIGHTGAGTFFFRTASDPGTTGTPSNYDLVISDSGNIGLGMGTFNSSLFPNHRLRIVGGPTWTSNGWSGAMELDNGAAIAWRANANGQRFGIGHTGGGLFFFRTSSDPGTVGAPAIYDLTIGEDGLVGIKVLRILGGSDFSENFDVNVATKASRESMTAQIEPGMVVAIDPLHPGKLTISSRAYNRRVAGIISGAGGVKPGMMMGQEGTLADGKHPVALTGRVYCWADASNGPIEPGDLLTTSGTPGHAMKVTNHKKAQGAIIGKAMTSLKEGQGLVLVLVTLQ